MTSNVENTSNKIYKPVKGIKVCLALYNNGFLGQIWRESAKNAASNVWINS